MQAVRVRDLDQYIGRRVLLQFDTHKVEFILHSFHKGYEWCYLYKQGLFEPVYTLKSDFIVSVLPHAIELKKQKIEETKDELKEVKMTEVFGRPVVGEIRQTSTVGAQDDPLKLVNLIDELLALPGVIEYKWVQYTPYWMDGEECEFGVVTDYNAGVKLEFGNEDGGEAGDGYYENFSVSWYPELKEHDLTEYEKAIDAVVRALHGGSHDVWLKETFGDHATVIANKEGFKVEFYEHG